MSSSRFGSLTKKLFAMTANVLPVGDDELRYAEAVTVGAGADEVCEGKAGIVTGMENSDMVGEGEELPSWILPVIVTVCSATPTGIS